MRLDLVLADLVRLDLLLVEEAIYLLRTSALPGQVHARAFVCQVAVGLRDAPETVFPQAAPTPGVFAPSIS